MGRFRFKLSNMIPNAWFYKLRDMSSINGGNKKRGSITAPKVVNPGRASYYIPRPDEGSPELPPFHPKALDTKFLVDPPRKSKKKTRKPSAKLVRCSNTSHCSCPPVLVNDDPSRSRSSSSSRVDTSSSPLDNATVDLSSSSKSFDLPPIVTRRGGGGGGGEPTIPKKQLPQRSPRRKRVPCDGGGVRLRGNSPRLAWRKKGSSSESFAVVVKVSSDPRKDFRESMLEMIVENGIGTTNDLEELLVCFLSLNSPEYHDVIVQVFQKIWFDLSTMDIIKASKSTPP